MAEIPRFIPEKTILPPVAQANQGPDSLRIKKIMERKELVYDPDSAYDPTVRLSDHEYCLEVHSIELADPNIYD